MIVPAQRAVWSAVAVLLPALTLAGFEPRLMPLSAVVVAVWLIALVVDAVQGRERADSVEVRLPQFLRLTKDVPATLPVTITRKTFTTARVRLALPLPEGIESELKLQTVDAPAHLEVPSPWGLWHVRQSRAIDFTFRVYPNLRDRSTASLFLRTAPGLRMRRQVGKGREFDNLRHYVPGDSFEDIHWKATARRAFPVVKLYRVEHAQEVYAVIDSSRLSAREGILESYVDAALHLAIVAERQGDRFGLATFSDRTHRFVRARGGLEHFRLCREAIYNLRAERVSPNFREVFTTLQLNLRHRSLIVFFTSLDDALLAETFEHEVPLLARRHLVLVNVTSAHGVKPLFTGEPAANIDDLYAGLAGQILWNRMRTLEIALQRRGVQLSMVAPGTIKDRVASEYLEVKRRQAL
jgi:uncharacterized protein (DUF58 family)